MLASPDTRIHRLIRFGALCPLLLACIALGAPAGMASAQAAHTSSGDEVKLEGDLREILHLAEQADSSSESRRMLDQLLEKYRGGQIDSLNRIDIELELGETSAYDSITALVQAQDGKVDYMGSFSSYMICRVHPKTLRDLIGVGTVHAIRIRPRTRRE